MKKIVHVVLIAAIVLGTVPVAIAQAISGTANVCIGSATALTAFSAVGTWSSNNNAVAAIDPFTGIVTGISADTTTITYTSSAGSIASLLFTVNPNPASISGASAVCVGATAALSDSNENGNWSSSDSTIANIDVVSGIMSGIGTGVAAITYTFWTGCMATRTVTVNALPSSISGVDTLCAGAVVTLNDPTGGVGTWASGNGAVATVGATTGVLAGKTGGTASITYAPATGCGILTALIRINAAPAVITGTSAVCAGSVLALTDASIGGSWGFDNSNAITIDSIGAVTGVAAGTSCITYTNAAGCSVKKTVTVNPLAAPISGANSVCVGSTINLTDVTPGGKWSSSNAAVAAVGSVTGMVTGKVAGTAYIYYTLSSGCGIVVDTITVNALPSAITGTAAVCAGLTTSLGDPDGNGVWSSANSSVATTDSMGTITGNAAGTATIAYTNTVGCMAKKTVTVNALPATISGAATVCTGVTSALTDAGGGKWSAANTAVATIGSLTGVVTGKTVGTLSITYKLATGCMTANTITVNSSPAAITGTASICAGLTTTLSNATATGNWSADTSGIATVDNTGIVTAASAGTANITYTIANGCIAKKTVTVNTLPSNISGVSSVCALSTTSLSDGLTGGKWTSSNTKIATIGLSNGIIAAGTSAGTTNITYTLATGCRTTAGIVVNALPSAITGVANVCGTAQTNLSNPVSGGTWSLDNTSVAAIDGSGVLSGISAGTAKVTYTLASGCGYVTKGIVVNPLPSAITGSNSICTGVTAALVETGSGRWSSSSPGVASVGSVTGIVTGISAGAANITYMISTGCITTTSVTVNVSPSAIAGTSGVCTGLATTLSDADGSGSWNSCNTSVAAIDNTGVVTGISGGTATISYTIANGCVAKKTVTVNVTPSSITGSNSVCAGLTISLSDAGGGKWSSCNTVVATIGSLTGVVTGKTSGTANMLYTLANGCFASSSVTVNPLPFAIAGTTVICVGTAFNLADTADGGSWNCSNTAVATIDGSGMLSGLTAGTVNITYALSSGCVAKKTLTVNAAPAAIQGMDDISIGSSITLSDCSGGKWSSGNCSVATIGSVSGAVTGITAGTVSITYKFASGCFAAKDITVNSSPYMPALSPDDSSFNNGTIAVAGSEATIAAPAGVDKPMPVQAILHVYPNPSHGAFHLLLSSPATEEGTMIITNLAGQKVMELPVVSNKEIQVNMQQGQSAGIYLITIVTASGRYEVKMVMNH